MIDLVEKAIYQIGILGDIEIIERISENWHGDIHYKIRVNNNYYSIRFISLQREIGTFPSMLMTDDILEAQLKLGSLYRDNGIPFMKLVSRNVKDATIIMHVTSNETTYRVLLFDWIEGVQLDFATETVAITIGNLLRKMHDLVSGYVDNNLVEFYSNEEYGERIAQLKELRKHLCSKYIHKEFEEYIILAELHLNNAFNIKKKLLIPIHGDLNFQNLLWDSNCKNIIGILDYDKIGLSERINELAWTIKWYSRAEGIRKEVFLYELAQKIFQGYGACDIFSKEELKRLPSLVWLHSCLNNNFIKNISKSTSEKDTIRTLRKYIVRGEKLYNICERLINYD